MRGETVLSAQTVSGDEFQSTPLMRGETRPRPRKASIRSISIHSPHARGDVVNCSHSGGASISIHSPHARGDADPILSVAHVTISIHSPHARGDAGSSPQLPSTIHFNPLPSCEGRPASRHSVAYSTSDFNPLPSCEGRLSAMTEVVGDEKFQSTPLMRGETQCRASRERKPGISIHSPHARGDDIRWSHSPSHCHFNPLPSCEGRRSPGQAKTTKSTISIHSPHARGDLLKVNGGKPRNHFNPLPSCEGRHDEYIRTDSEFTFQSTPLMRGETHIDCQICRFQSISIHSPHVRGDGGSFFIPRFPTYFNPLPSCEGRPMKQLGSLMGVSISIHSPHARGDCRAWRRFYPAHRISIHSPHARGDDRVHANADRQRISIHSPHARGDNVQVEQTASAEKFQSTPLMRGETSFPMLVSLRLDHFNPLPSCEGRPNCWLR